MDATKMREAAETIRHEIESGQLVLVSFAKKANERNKQVLALCDALAAATARAEAAEAERDQMEAAAINAVERSAEFEAREDRHAAQLRQAREALETAEAQFQAYAAQHAAKGTDDGAFKAEVNRDMARTMRAALTALSAEEAKDGE